MESNVYKRQYNQNIDHWWFEGRKVILKKILSEYIKSKKIILDYGCGVGINLNMLSEFGKIFYYDKSKLATNYVEKNYKKKKIFKKLSRLTMCKKKFDLVVATDVIEHIKNDEKEIIKLHGLLKKNGHILITVPAFQTLFSSKDISLKHYRRYDKKKLLNLLKNHFYEIKIIYFNFILFLPIAIMILFFKILNIKFIENVERKPNFLINKIAFYLFVFESFLINKIKFPFGVSLLFLGKKIND
jgi:SAM-dependent methyltransferase